MKEVKIIPTTVSKIGCGSMGRLLTKVPVKSFPSLYISINFTRSLMEEYTTLRIFLDMSDATERKKWSIFSTRASYRQ